MPHCGTTGRRTTPEAGVDISAVGQNRMMQTEEYVDNELERCVDIQVVRTGLGWCTYGSGRLRGIKIYLQCCHHLGRRVDETGCRHEEKEKTVCLTQHGILLKY